MANVRDSDTSLWLHNKLGTSNDTWIGGSICSQLNASVLRNIRECFVDLQTQVKLKLLLALLHTPRRNVEEWKVDIEEILEIAALDSDQWVSMLAEVMRTFPATGNLNTDIGKMEENKKIFGDLIAELKRLVKKNLDLDLLPLECHYLNKAALVASVGQIIQPEKHFALRRKPKSAALKVELLQKVKDASLQVKKNVMPSVPVRSRGMPRKMENATPLKGIPSRIPTGGFTGTSNLSRLAAAGGTPGRLARTPAGRKEGRVKMLDINEQPIGVQQIKKRKKLPEEEEKEAPSQPPPAAPKRARVTEGGGATPDYAAGLPSTNPPTPAASQPAASPAPAAPVSYAPQPDNALAGTDIPSVASQELADTPTSRPQPAAPDAVQAAPAMYAPQQGQPQIISQQTYQPVQQAAGMSPHNLSDPVQQMLLRRVVSGPQQQQQQPQQQAQQQQQVTIIAQPQANAQRRNLTLTREQMLEAQEMFRTANKVTRPEKALILGFIAGSRDNPCPHLGNVVTIKLSENQESVPQGDGGPFAAMVAETHFQMNYSTGEWKRIKKFRRLDEVAG
ncbi:negative elongation factor A-like isoform X2 [Pollicipes pollicipes]|uniref:negative elongation factor A-like isoform X2 n=1 Tax=Pollicipes pollicipes TaxID=41117 RepID=UPI00188528D3|nr:negative elongation factor A-like isoform X2 [Pollicipes pollicipes]